MANKIQLIIEAEDKASPVLKKFSANVQKSFAGSEKAVSGFGASMAGVARAIGPFLAAYAGFATLKAGATELIRISSSFEKMEKQLDTLTKGKGPETLERLNAWAKQMPIDTERAVQAFVRMKAMGLDPNIDAMTTMVDTTSALGGSSDVFDRITLALGQIATKGKLSAEELNQLAEAGVPARQILAEGLGVATSQLEELARKGID
ncbi:MAG: tape measure protein, partial [Deltaproteobacteria bacterium]|nr:tape measure protein [Deltaproteobacteria bacterium]